MPSNSPASHEPDSSTSSGPRDASDSSPSSRSRARGKDPLRRSRAGGFYVSVIGLGVLLILLVVFIAQNTASTTVNFLGLQADAPVAVLLLIAAAAGIMLAGIAASMRIVQLRRRIKRDRKP